MDEMKLELRLGPPGDDDAVAHKPSTNPAVLSLGYPSAGAKRGFSETVEPKKEAFKHQSGIKQQQCPPPSRNAAAAQDSSPTRAPVVGWPPIRSFRKNLTTTTITTSSSKPALEPDSGSSAATAAKAATAETDGRKGLFVKINMEGIPIGRKVDLKAYNSYEKLSLAVNDLFRSLLAAQRDPIAVGKLRQHQKEEEITGLLDGSGEYTLVYEDDEGDRMLVGDVPWEMFVSTAKRLRVLKSTELSTLRLGTISRKRAAVGC